MFKYLLSIGLLLTYSPALSQTHSIDTDTAVYSYVDKMPNCPYSLRDFININLNYNLDSLDETTENKLYVEVIIRKTGAVTDAQVISGTGNAGIDSEALRVVKQLPDWNPGSHNGIYVDVKQMIPIEFDRAHRFVDEIPICPYDLNRAIYRALKYPASAKRDRIEGRVNVQMIIRKDGTISNAKVVGKAPNKDLADEALRVVSSLPKWKPGKLDGNPVNVYYTIPIHFKL